jgi:hypothetical protein
MDSFSFNYDVEAKILFRIYFKLPVAIIRIITSRRVRWAGHIARRGAKRNAYRILVGKPKGKKSLRSPSWH